MFDPSIITDHKVEHLLNVNLLPTSGYNMKEQNYFNTYVQLVVFLSNQDRNLHSQIKTYFDRKDLKVT